MHTIQKLINRAEAHFGANIDVKAPHRPATSLYRQHAFEAGAPQQAASEQHAHGQAAPGAPAGRDGCVATSQRSGRVEDLAGRTARENLKPGRAIFGPYKRHGYPIAWWVIVSLSIAGALILTLNTQAP